MTDCFFCNTHLTKEVGMKIIGVPLAAGDFALVEINSPLHCEGCHESYVDTEQLLEGFNQIQAQMYGAL